MLLLAFISESPTRSQLGERKDEREMHQKYLCSTTMTLVMVRSTGSGVVIPQRETGKRNAAYRDEIQGFYCLGHSNWTICHLIGQFCAKLYAHISLYL